MDRDFAIGLAIAIAVVVGARLLRGWLWRRHAGRLEERARPRVFAYLDNVYLEVSREGGPTLKVVDIAAGLMEICEGKPGAVLSLYSAWEKERRAARVAADDESGIEVLDALGFQVALHGLGNLFGMIPEDSPSFDQELAQEGMRRGWRA